MASGRAQAGSPFDAMGATEALCTGRGTSRAEAGGATSRVALRRLGPLGAPLSAALANARKPGIESATPATGSGEEIITDAQENSCE